MTTRTNTKSAKSNTTTTATLVADKDSTLYATGEFLADNMSWLVSVAKDSAPVVKQGAVDFKAGWKAGWNTDR